MISNLNRTFVLPLFYYKISLLSNASALITRIPEGKADLRGEGCPIVEVVQVEVPCKHAILPSFSLS
jgi:hypothetical protein